MDFGFHEVLISISSIGLVLSWDLARVPHRDLVRKSVDH